VQAEPSPGEAVRGSALRVSVVVPTRNGASRLPLLFAALERQTLARDRFEVIVADDCSADETARLAAAHPLVRVVRAEEPRGCPGATNMGVAAARAPVLAFTDDDTVPAADWLERGLALVDAAPSRIVAGRIALAVPERPTAAALVDLGRGYLDQEAYVTEGYGATANLLVRRELFERLGGFDARFLGQGHDRAFGEAAREAGVEIVFAPDVVVEHPARSRARDLARVAFRLGRGAPELRRNGVGRLRELRAPWRQPRYWRPWRRVWGIARVREHGFAPGPGQRLAMRAVQYTCIQLPLVAGSIVGEARERRRSGA
jgi:GT2 family glycosyltransferase